MIPNLAESLEMFLPSFSSTVFPVVVICVVVSLLGIAAGKAYRWIKRNTVG